MNDTATPEEILSLAARTATKIGTFRPTTEMLADITGNGKHPYWKALENVFAPKTEIVSPALFKSSDTNLDEMLKAAESFAKKYFGIEVDLRKQFVIPENLPWKKVLVAFDPGSLTNRDAVDKAVKGLKLTVYEETDVMNYSGSEAFGAPMLHIIALSPIPDKDTMGLSPNDLRKTGKLYLRLRDYALAFALHHSMTGEYLDPKETFTWFPEDRLSSGEVADGSWRPFRRKVDFRWGGAGRRCAYGGARAAISVSLRS